MHAPLARHLVRFSRVPPAGASTEPLVPPLAEPVAAEPTLTMTAAALAARLEAARDELRATMAAEHAAHDARAEAVHADALASAVAAAEARRDAEEAAAIAAQIAASMENVRDTISETLAKALHALLAEAVATRTVAALIEMVERVLADPDHPALTVRGPAPLLVAIEAAPGMAGVTFEPSDTHEVTVTAAGIHIETRLAAALAAVADAQGA